MNEQTRQRIAAVRHLSVLADAAERGEQVQFLFDGSRRVTGEKVDDWGDTGSFPHDLDDEDIITHWRVRPEKKHRPWQVGEAPRCFMARRKGEAQIDVYFSRRDVQSDTQARMLFEDAARVLEDGSEVPCGVEVWRNNQLLFFSKKNREKL